MNILHVLVCGLHKDVFVHLDKFSNRHNLLHVGISFHDMYGSIRFDFRPNNDGRSYVTTAKHRMNVNALFSNYNIEDYQDREFAEYRENRHIETRLIHWGSTIKTWEDIMSFEKHDLCQRYVLGVYDCRHYVNRFTAWSTENATPIWSLHKLWYD